MNLLERSAMRRAEKRLAPLMDRTERVLDFDIGTTAGQRVDVIVSTRALYLAPNGRQPVRIDYTEIAGIRGEGAWIALRTPSGSELMINFGRANRNLIEILQDQYAERVKTFHVGWGRGFGVSFLVIDGKVDHWRYDQGTPEDLTADMIVRQALGELEVSLGITPGFGYEDPRPSWMPDLEWNPPLG